MAVKRNHLAALLVCTLLWAGCDGAAQSGGQKRGRAGDDSPVGRAFKSRTSNVQVEDEGVGVAVMDAPPPPAEAPVVAAGAKA